MNCSKYHAKKVTVDGITFDSRKEANRFCELKWLERAGKIKNLQRQVKFELTPAFKDHTGKVFEKSSSYTADFVYDEVLPMGLRRQIVEDVKGYRTKEYILKRKMMMERYGIRIREV